MAKCKLTPHEFIQNAFSPMVAVMCSPLVDQSCQKNNLSFIEMIQPFSKLNTEAHIREPSGTPVPVRNLRITMVDINSRPPQPTLARKFLNESVSLLTCERNSSLQVGSQNIEIPASVPWFEAWRETFLQVQFPSDHEFTKHFIACILVISSAENNTAEVLQQMTQQLQQMQNLAPAKLPKWFCTNVLRYFVLLHDTAIMGSEKIEASFNEMKTICGASNTYLLRINSRPPGQQDDSSHLPDPWSQFLIRQLDNQEGSEGSSPRTPAEMGGVTNMPSHLTMDEPTDVRPTVLEVGQEAGEHSAVTVTLHPLSPDALPKSFSTTDKNQLPAAPSHVNANVWAGQTSASQAIQHGACLTTGDLDQIRNMVQEFCTKALLPHIERQIQQLTDIISNKKGVSRSLFSATKRWFGSNKPGLPGSNTPINAVIYSNDAPELQLRRLGDLCFMFGHYTLAFQAYHSAKRDFSADQAWLYYAGALEMAALSAFMQGEPTRKAQDYMEESIVTYLNSCRMPQFATRATLLSTECLIGRNLYGEAAKQFIRMTSEDSDLRSALLLEQASYCFLKSTRPRMARKYAFHIVLAGHRFSKAGQRKHSLRCYRQAYSVYEHKSWSLAEDHIHFTIGRQAANLKLVNEAANAFSRLLTPSSRQSTVQQAAFLKEFLATQKQLQDEECSPNDGRPILPLPLVDNSSIRVLLGPLPSPPPTGVVPVVPATGVTFRDDPVHALTWSGLEEMLVAEAQGQLPMIFKPSIQLFTNQTNNTNQPTAVVHEPVNVCVMLENPLHIPLPLQDVHLLWSFTATSSQGIAVDNELGPQAHDSIVQTHCQESLLLKPDFIQEVVFSVTPKSIGELRILGIAYLLTSPTVEPAGNGTTVSNSIAIPGKQLFTIKPLRTKSAKERPNLDVVPDKRLEIDIMEPAPCLQVYFKGLHSEMLSGELHLINMEFVNVGKTALKNLHIAWSRADLVSLGQPVPQVDPSQLQQQQQQQQQQHRRRHVRHIVLPEGGLLEPGQSHVIPMWLRAPDAAGPTSLNLLFYYENVNTNSRPRYRLVRHCWALSVMPSIQVSVTAMRSDTISQNVGEEVLNLMMSIKNSNQIHEPVVAEICVRQLSLASQVWRLTDQVVMPQSVKLQSQEVLHLMVKAYRIADEKNVFSSVPVGSNTEPLPGMDISPYRDFFNCRMDPAELSDNASVPSNDNVADGNANKENSLQEIKMALKVDASLIVRWKAVVTNNEDNLRSATGQHHLTIDKVGVAAICPPLIGEVLQHQEPIKALKIFGPDAELDQITNPKDTYTSFDVLQRLVTYSIQHPPSITHDFKKNRLCVVPVKLLLHNCSNSSLIVRVNTSGNSSTSTNKHQLYSPHSSGAYRWVSVAGAWLDLAPHGSGSVELSAALASPGTYDLGARLEVSCRPQGTTEADSVPQSWRSESALVVGDSSSLLSQCT